MLKTRNILQAIKNGHIDVVKMFFSNQYDFNKSDLKGLTPLHYSINMRQPKISEFLIKNVKINLSTIDEVSLAHF